MRFGLVHRLMTDSLAAFGILALVTSGKLNLVVALAIVSGMALALAVPSRLKQQSFLKLAGVVAPIVVLAVQVTRLALGSDPIPVIVEFAAFLQIIRLSTRRGAVHDHQVILLALLHLIAGTVLGGGLTYALALLGFLVLTPGALVLSHLRREVEGNYRQGARDRTGMPVDVPRILRSRRVIGRGFLLFTCLLSLPVFLFTALLFLIFPRVGFSWLVVPPVEPQRVVGFSDRVDLGGVGTIRSDPTLVMRVRPRDLPEDPPQRRNLYLRGAVFNHYDGRAWSRTAGDRSLRSFSDDVVLLRHPRPGDRSTTIELEPISPKVLFVPDGAVAISLLERKRTPGGHFIQLLAGPLGQLHYRGGEKSGVSYRVYLPPVGRVTPDLAPPDRLQGYLQLPASLSPDISELASQIASDRGSALQAAKALESELRRAYQYDLSSPSGGAEDPLHHFLFESKRGHCEFYSTAMVMMLRTLGIPSRNVTGFVGGTYNRFGDFYAVRQGDAHAWVEAYLPDRGWTRFDPTPPSSASPQSDTEGVAALVREIMEAAAQSWSQNVVGFDMDQQLSLFRSLRRAAQDVSHSISAPSGSGFNAKRLAMIAAGIALLVAAVILIRRARRKSSGPAHRSPAQVLRSIDLCRRLDLALAQRGVPRPEGTPVRSHARALLAAGHPTGAEALALADIYLSVRFGGRPLSAREEKDFLRRAAELRRGDDRRKSSEASAHAA